MNAHELYIQAEENDNLKQVAQLRQDQYQHDNLGLYLYEVDGQYILKEDYMVNANYHLFSKEDVGDNFDKFLKDCADTWARNEGDELELYRWGVKNCKDDAVPEDYEGEVKIVAERSFFGYNPIDYLQDEQGEVVVFDSAAEAQEEIDQLESRVYYLKNNEAARPDYTIVKA